MTRLGRDGARAGNDTDGREPKKNLRHAARKQQD
jgi:hypothetical protein